MVQSRYVVTRFAMVNVAVIYAAMRLAKKKKKI